VRDNKLVDNEYTRTPFHLITALRILSVKREICDKKEERSVPIFHTIRKIIWPSFLKRRMVGGDDPFYLKFWVNRPAWSEIARSGSTVTPSEKFN